MKRKIIVILIGFLFLSGCTIHTYKGGIEPISPGMNTFGKEYETVDSLTPTFRWKSDAKSSCTYDFGIWDVGESLPHGTGTMVMRGPALYYKEALFQPEHTVEIPLGPDTLYFWSVRTRCDNKVSSWATRDYSRWLIVASSTGQNWPYSFKTPKIEK